MGRVFIDEFGDPVAFSDHLKEFLLRVMLDIDKVGFSDTLILRRIFHVVDSDHLHKHRVELLVLLDMSLGNIVVKDIVGLEDLMVLCILLYNG